VYGNVDSVEEAIRQHRAPFHLRRVKEALVHFPDLETGAVRTLFTKRKVETIGFASDDEEWELYDALTRYVEDQSIKAAAEDSARGRRHWFHHGHAPASLCVEHSRGSGCVTYIRSAGVRAAERNSVLELRLGAVSGFRRFRNVEIPTSRYTQPLKSAFFVHAAHDHHFARQLAEFLEFGCDLTCYVEDGLIGDGQDVISKAEEGLSADVLVLLLSPSSSLSRWARERWESVLVHEAKRSGTEVVIVLLEECSFPPLLRRRDFIDGTKNRLAARRLLKRWFWRRERESRDLPSNDISDGLENLYSNLADRVGVLSVSGGDASEFAREAADEFEAVLWVPCHGRTLAQAAGELASQLGLTLDGPVKENCGRIRDLLSARRCLVVLDAPSPETSAELTAGARTSTAITREAVRVLETPRTPAYARSLVAARRYAEAYELFYELLDAVIDPDGCARELTWICEHWDRAEEANALRFNYGPAGGEQLTLF